MAAPKFKNIDNKKQQFERNNITREITNWNIWVENYVKQCTMQKNVEKKVNWQRIFTNKIQINNEKKVNWRKNLTYVYESSENPIFKAQNLWKLTMCWKILCKKGKVSKDYFVSSDLTEFLSSKESISWCWNVRIFLSLRFSVKSHLTNFRVSKDAI